MDAVAAAPGRPDREIVAGAADPGKIGLHFYNRVVRALLLTSLLLVPCRADVVVHTLDGKPPLRGISLAADARTISLHSAEGAVVKVATSKVVEVFMVPPPAAVPVHSRPFELLLTDGSRLRGTLDAGPAGSVRVRSPVLRETVDHLDVRLEDVMSVRRVDGKRIPGASRLIPVHDSDAVYTLTGARVTGTIAAFTPTSAVIDREVGAARGIPYDALAAIFLDNQALDRLHGLHVVARLADGSAIVLKENFKVLHGTLSGEMPSGIAIRIPAKQVAALGFMGGSFVHVSDLEAEVKRRPFFPLAEGPAKQAMLDFVCPVRKDESPDGHPITINKRRYYKGIGVRPHTELTYDLAGKYREFQARCGIDDEIFGPGYGRGGGTGSVIFRVLAEGKQVLFESRVVVGGEEPVDVRIPVVGVRKLTLVVALVPGNKLPRQRPDSPELDNAVWARPLLIR